MTRDSAIDEIIQKARIDEIAAKLNLPLGARSKDYVLALCPFHNDTDPSLRLFTEPGNPHYHCFACGENGGVIDLVEKLRETPREDAIQWLARETGVPLGSDGTRLRKAASFAQWLDDHRDADLLASFAQAREIDATTLEEFGCRAVDMDALDVSALSAEQKESMERTGILGRRQDKLIVLVRGRQMAFPVPHGFVFRMIERRESDTPEGEGAGKAQRYRFPKGFKRSETLFGLDQAKEALKGKAEKRGLFVVEGVMDALRLHSLGFASVAILGASLSEAQATQIATLCERGGGRPVPVHLFLDFDIAGRRASPAALRALLQADPPPMVDVIWQGAADAPEDPDALLKGMQPEEAAAFIAGRAHSVLAVLAASFAGLPVTSVFSDLRRGADLTRVATLRYLLSEIGPRWDRIRDIAPADSVFFPEAENDESEKAAWLRAALDRGVGVAPDKGKTTPAGALQEISLADEESAAALRLALRLAQSSNFRREYPFDWGGMTRLSLAARATTMTAEALLKMPGRRPMPYAARTIPKEGGRTRLKAGPWPEDALLQQYVLSELLRTRPTPERTGDDLPEAFGRRVADAARWFAGIPAVRRVRRLRRPGDAPIMTGPDPLLPVGPPGEPAPVVAFAYQIDQEIVDGETPPSREGMFVPYRECWQQFIDHFDSFIARQPLETAAFYAVRLDITGFFDHLPRHAVEEVLNEALRRAADSFAKDAFGQAIAPLLAPEERADNRQRASALTRWLADQSFGFRHFDPGDGQIVDAPRKTVGVPQGPDLSAFLANIALFPVDRAATQLIEKDRKEETSGAGARAIYGRYVDDMVIISTSEPLLARLETLIAETLREKGLSINAKHERTRALSRSRVRDWLVGENGAAILVSAGGEATPTTEAARVQDLLQITAASTRSDVLQLLFHPDLLSSRWSEGADRKQVEDTLRRLRGLPSLKLRHNDWTSAARWALHSAAHWMPAENDDTFAEKFWTWWSKIYGRDQADEIFGETRRDRAAREDQLALAPLLLALDGLERLIDSRHDRRSDLDPELRMQIRQSRERMAKLVLTKDLCHALIEKARSGNAIRKALPRVEAMLDVQSMTIMALAAAALPEQAAAQQVEQQLPSGVQSRDYMRRRFAINALGRRISWVKDPFVADLFGPSGFCTPDDAPDMEPLLGLHEAIARLTAGPGADDADALAPIAAPVSGHVRELQADAEDRTRAATDIATLVSQFLEKPATSATGRDAAAALSALVEILTGAPEANHLLAHRDHLLSGIVEGECSPLAAPPGVDVKGFLAWCGKDLRAFSVPREEEPAPKAEEDVFGVTAQSAATDGAAAQTGALQRYDCALPEGFTHLAPVEAKTTPAAVNAKDLQTFARAYRSLAVAACKLAEGEGVSSLDHRPITPLHLLQPDAANGDWGWFGARSGMKIGAQAFMRLSDKRLISQPVHANGRHLWQIGYALADAMGYRGFVRAAAEDRLSIEPLEPDHGPDAIPFYTMQLMAPRLCGALIQRTGFSIDYGGAPPRVVDRQLRRLEALSEDVDDARRVARLLEAGAEIRAIALVEKPPAALEVAGALSDVFRAIGLASARAEPIFAENLPDPKPAALSHRRIADQWLCAAARLDGVSAGEADLGLRSVSAAMRVAAISRLLQALTLEIWSILSDEDRRALEHFRPDPDALDLPADVLLVRASHRQSAPRAEDQAVRLIRTLSQHAAPGVTSRLGLEPITPLGWATALATMTGLIDITPTTEEGEPERPALGAERRRKGGDAQLGTERKLLEALLDLCAFLSIGTPEGQAEPGEDERETWKLFAPLVDQASAMTTRALEAAALVDSLYGFEARTRRSPFLDIAQADERGGCFVKAAAENPVKLAGWKIDRGSLGPTRTGDAEREDDEFIWSQTRRDGRIIGLSIAYRSLAGFGKAPLASAQSAEAAQEAEEPARDEATPEPATESPSTAQDTAPAEGAAAAAATDPRPEPGGAIAPSAPAQNASAQDAERKLAGDARSNHGSGSPGSTSGAAADGLNGKLEKIFDSWEASRKRAPDEEELHPGLRVALLQMNCNTVGHSYYPPKYENIPLPLKNWEDPLKVKFNEESSQPSAGEPTAPEMWRRAILSEALRRCDILAVDLLILPEYSTRQETIDWIAEELQARDSKTSVLAGTFKHPAGAGKLPERYRGLRDRDVQMGAILPLIIPAAALEGNDRDETESRIYGRLKKYPSTGLSEYIRLESKRLRAVYEMETRDSDDEGHDSAIPERLRYVRDLICSEVFMTMSPANILSVIPSMIGLERAIEGDMAQGKEHFQADIIQDLLCLAKDTSPMQRQELAWPRKTVLAVPAATTRPFDHHVFGEASAKAAGLTTVFTNLAGLPGGKSCFIGCYSATRVEGTVTPGLQTPYCGRSPGVWTFDFPGGKPLDHNETALVVADVKTIDTATTKPARQMDIHPVTLVAHIPFFLAPQEKEKRDDMEEELSALCESIIATDPKSDNATKQIRDILKALPGIDKNAKALLTFRAELALAPGARHLPRTLMPMLLDWAYVRPHDRTPGS